MTALFKHSIYTHYFTQYSLFSLTRTRENLGSINIYHAPEINRLIYFYIYFSLAALSGPLNFPGLYT